MGESAEQDGEFGDARAGRFECTALPPGPLEIELAATAVRAGALPGGGRLELTKGTVYSSEATVGADPTSGTTAAGPHGAKAAAAGGSRLEGSPMRWDTARGGWRAKRPDDAESDEEDVPVATGRLPEPELCLDILTEAEAWPRDEMKASAGGSRRR
jgi:hypothetical protein